jgi:hypothetical protein
VTFTVRAHVERALCQSGRRKHKLSATAPLKNQKTSAHRQESLRYLWVSQIPAACEFLAKMMPMPTFRLVSAISLCILLTSLNACREPKVSMSFGPREYVASDYSTVLKRWTRSGSLVALDELDELLKVTATFETWDFRWAYVVRYAEDYRLTMDQRRSLLDRTLSETRDAHHFYVAIASDDRRGSNLASSTSPWIVRLIDSNGGESAPLSIENVKRPTPLERTYFPYTTVWRTAFRLKFPRYTKDGLPTIDPKAHWVGLRFAGAQGHQELRWELANLPMGRENLDSARHFVP